MRITKARIIWWLGFVPGPDMTLGDALFERFLGILGAELEALGWMGIGGAVALAAYLAFGISIHPNVFWITIFWQLIAAYKWWTR